MGPPVQLEEDELLNAARLHNWLAVQKILARKTLSVHILADCCKSAFSSASSPDCCGAIASISRHQALLGYLRVIEVVLKQRSIWDKSDEAALLHDGADRDVEGDLERLVSGQVVHALATSAPTSAVAAAAVGVMLQLLPSPRCGDRVSRRAQQQLACHGAVPALTAAVHALLRSPRPHADNPCRKQRLGPRLLPAATAADGEEEDGAAVLRRALTTLGLLCFQDARASQQFLEAGGWAIVTAGLRAPDLNPESLRLLASLAAHPTAVLPHALLLEAAVMLTNALLAAAAQSGGGGDVGAGSSADQRQLSALRAAAWALVQMAAAVNMGSGHEAWSTVEAPGGGSVHAGPRMQPAPFPPALPHLLCDQALLSAVASCLKAGVGSQDTTLAKHCLDLVWLVCAAEQASASPPSSHLSLRLHPSGVVQAVMHALGSHSSPGVKAAALRAIKQLHRLLPPEATRDVQQRVVLLCLDACAKARSGAPSSKATNLIQVQGLCLLADMVAAWPAPTASLQPLKLSTAIPALPHLAHSIEAEVHAALAHVTQYLSARAHAHANCACGGVHGAACGHDTHGDEGERVHEPLGPFTTPAHTVAVGCRLGPACGMVHERLEGTDLEQPAAAAATILRWCTSVTGGNSPGVNGLADVSSGNTHVHAMAGGGLHEGMLAFLSAAGVDLDLGAVNAAGQTARQLGLAKGHQEAAQVLKVAESLAAPLGPRGHRTAAHGSMGTSPTDCLHPGSFGSVLQPASGAPSNGGGSLSSSPRHAQQPWGQNWASPTPANSLLGADIIDASCATAPAGESGPALRAPYGRVPGVCSEEAVGQGAFLGLSLFRTHHNSEAQTLMGTSPAWLLPAAGGFVAEDVIRTALSADDLEVVPPRSLGQLGPVALPFAARGMAQQQQQQQQWTPDAASGSVSPGGSTGAPGTRRGSDLGSVGVPPAAAAAAAAAAPSSLIPLAEQLQPLAALRRHTSMAGAAVNVQPVQVDSADRKHSAPASLTDRLHADGSALNTDDQDEDEDDMSVLLTDMAANDVIVFPDSHGCALAGSQRGAASTVDGDAISSRGSGDSAGAATDNGSGGAGSGSSDAPEGKPCRHLWLGNMPLKPNKAAVELLFSQFGPLDSVRVFPGKTFAFVNFVRTSHAIAAKEALDSKNAPAVTGTKVMVIRFQKDTSGAPGSADSSAVSAAADSTDLHLTSGGDSGRGGEGSASPGSASAWAAVVAAAGDAASPRAAGATAAGSQATGSFILSGPGSEDGSGCVPSSGAAGLQLLNAMLQAGQPPEPVPNLSNRLNPNNVHFDKELAARYKRMSKAEKEMLWAQDRAMQHGSPVDAAGTAAMLLAGRPAAAADGHMLGAGQLPSGAASAGMAAAPLLPTMGASASPVAFTGRSHISARAIPAASLIGYPGGAAGMQQPAPPGLMGGSHMASVAGGVRYATVGLGTSGRGPVTQQVLPAALYMQQQGLACGNTLPLAEATSGGQSFAALGLTQVDGMQYPSPKPQVVTQIQQQSLASAGHVPCLSQPTPGLTEVQSMQLQLQQLGLDIDVQALDPLTLASLKQALQQLGVDGGAAASGAGGYLAPFAQDLTRQQHPMLQQQQQHALRWGQQQGVSAAAAAWCLPDENQAQQGSPQMYLISRAGADAQRSAFMLDGCVQDGATYGSASELLSFPGTQASSGGSSGFSAAAAPHSGGFVDVASAAVSRVPGAGSGMTMLRAANALPRYSNGSQQLLPAGDATVFPGGMPPTAGQQAAQAAAQAQVAAAQAAQLNALAALSGHRQLSATFICPLSRRLMLDPVVASDGVTYDRSAITDWMQRHRVSPVTRQNLANKFLAPNYALRAAIASELAVRGVTVHPSDNGLLLG